MAIEAGVPVEFGTAAGPVWGWDFGDGTAPMTGACVTHAFARAGSYTVRALADGEEHERAQLTVIPRPVLHAVPPSAEAVVYVPVIRNNLSALLDFVERLTGPARLQHVLDGNVLMQRAFGASVSGAEGLEWLDAEEGLALYVGEDGMWRAALGIADSARALEEMEKGLAVSAGSPWVAEDGSLRLTAADGEALALWEDRGYLHLAVVEAPEDAARRLDAAVQSVRHAPNAGLAGRVGDAEDGRTLAAVSLRAVVAPVDEAGRLWMAGKFVADSFEFEGVLDQGRPLWATESAVRPGVLSDAAEGPILALSASVDPALLSGFLWGQETEDGVRRGVLRQLVAPGDRALLLQAFDGTLAAAAYFDAQAFLEQLLEEPKSPQFRGGVWVWAGVREVTALRALLSRWAEPAGLHPVGRFGGVGQVARFAGYVFQQPAALELRERQLTLALGTNPPLVDGALATSLAQRFGEDAFGPGHVSMLLDIGRLRAQLRAGETDRGAEGMKWGMMQRLATRFVDELTPVDHVFADLWPSAQGARLRGRVALRPR